MLLEGKTGLVTGGAAGIGRAVALRFAEEGARVIIADSNEQSGREVENEVRALGGEAWFIPVEMANLASIRHMVAQAITKTGVLDILVNNAGVTKRVYFFDMSEEDWDWIHGVNTKGFFFCLQAVAAHMRDRNQGKVINMASIGGKGVRGTSNTAYAGSKAAAIAVTRVAAADLGAYNINVNAVCPGPTRTAMLGGLEVESPEIMDAVKRASVLGRINQPKDVADVVVFLASNLASNITGQSINVDNGLMWD